MEKTCQPLIDTYVKYLEHLAQKVDILRRTQVDQIPALYLDLNATHPAPHSPPSSPADKDPSVNVGEEWNPEDKQSYADDPHPVSNENSEIVRDVPSADGDNAPTASSNDANAAAAPPALEVPPALPDICAPYRQKLADWSMELETAIQAAPWASSSVDSSIASSKKDSFRFYCNVHFPLTFLPT